MKSFAEVFDKVLEYIHQKVLNNELTKVAYDMWLKSMIPDRLDGNVASRRRSFSKTTVSCSKKLSCTLWASRWK